MPEVARLRENLLHDMTVQVGEAEVASFVFKDEFFVLDAKEVELYEKMIAGVKAKKISQQKMIIGRPGDWADPARVLDVGVIE